ncbi:MAG TPA: hypothetical protein VFC84_05160 [Desulfosporosinus sp.]|nr:hypothetical protein [Desulfosporosinus sp.]
MKSTAFPNKVEERFSEINKHLMHAAYVIFFAILQIPASIVIHPSKEKKLDAPHRIK